MVGACLEYEICAAESDAEEESGQDKGDNACDDDAGDAVGETTDTGLELGSQVLCVFC